MKVCLKNPQATEEFGKNIGRFLQSGDVVCLSGDLGAGKTCLCQGIASALGVAKQDVTSPTFTIMNIYDGNLAIHHFDFYRLNRAEELDDIGFDEYACGEGVTLIEWAEMFLERLPDEYLQINLFCENEGRRAKIIAKGKRYEKLVENLQNVYFGN